MPAHSEDAARIDSVIPKRKSGAVRGIPKAAASVRPLSFSQMSLSLVANRSFASSLSTPPKEAARLTIPMM
jgi:hypothetical protein